MMERKTLHITTQGTIALGRQGENGVTEVHFPQPSALLEETWTLNHQRATDTEAYPVALTKEGHDLVWLVSSGDTAIPGAGKVELTCYGSGGEVLKSMVYNTKVVQSLTTGEEVPDPVKPWYDALMEEIHQGGGAGTPGEDGGYYTPAVTQTGDSTMRVAYTPSETDMPAVPAVDIDLPAGPQGPKGDTGPQGPKGEKGDRCEVYRIYSVTYTANQGRVFMDYDFEQELTWPDVFTYLTNGMVVMNFYDDNEKVEFESVVSAWIEKKHQIYFWNPASGDFMNIAIE